ncbi:MAG: glycoside hydrolase family 6 protein [Nocardioides sp.]
MSPRTTLPSLIAALLLTGLLTAPAPAAPDDGAPVAARRAAVNPLAGREWGVYRGPAEMAWQPYVDAKGQRKKLLAKIALRPKAKWFGAWIPDREIGGKVREYVANATGGDDEVMVHMTLFRVVPWEQDACKRLPTAAEKTSYKRYVRRFAAAIDDTHAAIVLQPDGPFALCSPGRSRVLSGLVQYAARRLGALPHASVYIDVGSAGWNHHDPANAVRQLVRGGIEHVRGFHLNTTHYEATVDEIGFGAKVVAALAARGLTGKHFTVDTAENGRPFTWQDWSDHPQGEIFNNAKTCETAADRRCVTLGIPPTTRVAAKRWGLPDQARRLARRHVDAYLWAGRPWLVNQTAPFSMDRALDIARTTPY